MNTEYERVIPRDFFNESKLLKCMGILALRILDNETPCEMSIEGNGEPFKIGVSIEGGLHVVNYRFSIKGHELPLYTTQNSKSNFPFFVMFEGYNEIEVFDDKGNFTKEFIQESLILK